MVSLPPLFLENMDALDCKKVVLSVLDKDHILIEVIRNE